MIPLTLADEDPGIGILLALRHELGIELQPGDCRDCAGLGVIPDFAGSLEVDRGVWKTCPTCRGDRRGGVA